MILVKKHIPAHFDTKCKGGSKRKIQKLSKRKADLMRRKGRWTDVMYPNLHWVWVHYTPPSAVNILKEIPNFISSLNIGKRQRYSRHVRPSLSSHFSSSCDLVILLFKLSLLLCMSSTFIDIKSPEFGCAFSRLNKSVPWNTVSLLYSISSAWTVEKGVLAIR